MSGGEPDILVTHYDKCIPLRILGVRVRPPFTREEADALLAEIYESTSGYRRFMRHFFEFSFYTDMRPGEVMALRWSEVDTRKRTAKVRRLRIYAKTKERRKTKASREVLLNDPAPPALDKTRPLTAVRSDLSSFGAVFPSRCRAKTF